MVDIIKNNNIHTSHSYDVALLVLHFDIFGKDDNDEQPANIKLILVTLLVFHFDISGNDINE